jgi:DNA-binding NtrC family response regulator
MEKARILIVEDEAIIAMELESQLQSLGYEVASVVNIGEKAIEKAEEEKPDLILMDIRIKGNMDGITAAEIIRSQSEIPIIFITAHADMEKLERAKKVLPLAYLIKPVKAHDLKVSIEMALHLSQVYAERKKAEHELLKKTHDLEERVKELKCLIAISELVEKSDLPLTEIFQGIVDLIPRSWQYPDITCAQLIIDGQEFKTEKFLESTWRQTTSVIVKGAQIGVLNVFYLEEKPAADEGPFLKEERNLIDAVARRLGKIIEHSQSEEKLGKALHQLQQLSDQLKDQNIYLQEEIKQTQNFDTIISKNKEFLKILSSVEKVAASQTTVLITGETGTGKELIARILHNLSDRKDYPLVKINCAALPANLIESELFGYEKGAFTGAVSCKKGRFELAHNSTIFLDEIGELPLELQAKILRVLEENEFERLGGVKTLKVNVRVIAATNKNLKKQSEEGKFRSDLFFRLNVFPIECIPLRDRKDDIPLLVKHFIEMFNKQLRKNIEIIPQHVFDILKEYSWPGNIRELKSIIERSMILSSGIQLEIGNWFSKNVQVTVKSSIPSLDELQKAHILHVLKLTNGKVSGEGSAAKILKLNRSTLQARMKKLGITVGKNTAQI